jgi:site-specific DNA recombinase
MKIAVYYRVSTDEQAAEDRFGLPRQRAAVEAYVAEHGHEIAATYEDAGYSGSSADRPALCALLDDAASGAFEGIVVCAWDRLARDAHLDGWLRVEFRKRGVTLLSASEQNGIDELSKLTQVILSGVAGFERSLITARLAGGRRAKAASGGYAHGQAPFGTKAERGTGVLHHDAAEWATLCRMHDLRDQGLTLRAIAEMLNSEGYKPRKASRWDHTVVRSALRSYPRAAAVASKIASEAA